MDKARFLAIGCGSRGVGMIPALAETNGAEIVALCDVYEDRVEEMAQKIEKISGTKPTCYTDSEKAFCHDVDAVFICSSWETHIPFALKAMEMGIITLVEVGGAYSVDDCHRLVETYERTKTPIMMLENCCYNKTELMATAMVRDGLFGDIIHCEGEYAHDLRQEITKGEENRHYRLRNYINRNCENYPTHELGPIAKVLNINRGNRMVSLVSVASKAAGLEAYINSREIENKKLIGQKFNQGDVVTTVIKCAGGETITLKLDTTLPRHYSRNFTLHGTKGLYEQNHNLVFFDGMEEIFDTAEFYEKYMNNSKEYEEKYLCDQWKGITKEEIEAGHGGMDVVMLKDAVDCILNGREFPIDVYDMAAWMVITPLSEISIAQGGHPIEIPDFTHGSWIQRNPLDVVKLPSYNK
ncbi:MAG: Gfo/Idh/MocA family oxidoreductase [Clostridia bacterium]|nr:Gfo/Idh/MocA family oxidoreductase [Clostridia bacterium]